MAVVFPSVEFFASLQERMRKEAERFRRLGFIDTTFGIRIRNGLDRSFIIAFEVFDCVGVHEVESLAGEPVDFVFDGDRAGNAAGPRQHDD